MFLSSLLLILATDCRINLSTDLEQKTHIEALIGNRFAGAYQYHRITPKVVVVDSMFIQPDFERRGLSTYLAGQMLAREKEVTQVSAILILDNLELSGLKYVNRPITFEECVLAVKQTPFYKTFKHFLFETVSECFYDKAFGYIRIQVRK